MKIIKRINVLCGLLLTGLISPVLMAHGNAEQVTPVAHTQISPEVFSHATAIRVDYAPGAASGSHRHPGHVFVVVLNGAVESAVDGEPAQHYKTGDAWYESPQQLHRVSRNASQTEPATLLVWLLSDGEEALVLPEQQP